MTTDRPVDIKPRSRQVTDGMTKAPARAMLRAIGLTDDDWAKPQVGIANSWNDITPCNMTLRALAEDVRAGIREAGGVAMEFGTLTVSDAISMGHEGMRASLVSRDLSCDSVEAVVFAESLDGFVGMAGCDKSMPAMLMASARLDLPSILVYNGSILPGEHAGRSIDITSVFEAVGAAAAGTITEEELGEIERKACPGEGACGGMFTANTMSSIGEALGMSLPGSASPPAVDPRRHDDAEGGRRGGRPHARARHHAADDHDQAGVRERHRRHLGARRVDERRAAPAGDRLRGGRRVAPRGLQPDRRPRPPHRGHEARRQVPHERPRPRRRRAGRPAPPARRRAPRTATS